MYKEVPTGEISLEEFEEYALDRLRGATVLHLPSLLEEGSMKMLSMLWRAHEKQQLIAPLTAVWLVLLGVHTTVLKAIEEAKLRSKSEDIIQVSAVFCAAVTRQLQQLQHMCSRQLHQQECLSAKKCLLRL
jgi:hypothetical protein